MENEFSQENEVRNEQSIEKENYKENSGKFTLQKQTKTVIALFVAGLCIAVALVLFVIMTL